MQCDDNILLGMCLAVEMIRLNLSKFTPPPSSRTITVTFAARTHPYPNDANISLGQGAIYAAAMRNGGVIGNTVIGELGRNLVQDVGCIMLICFGDHVSYVVIFHHCHIL